jgi:hypothetical protein
VRHHRIVLALAALSAAFGCHEPPTCYEGEFQACSCGEARGYQRCEAGSYAACICDGETPGVDGGGGEGGEGGGGLAGFLEPCTGNEDCESGLCHEYNSPPDTFLCTLPCDGPEDCPPPSAGCNMMGICKKP